MSSFLGIIAQIRQVFTWELIAATLVRFSISFCEVCLCEEGEPRTLIGAG